MGGDTALVRQQASRADEKQVRLIVTVSPKNRGSRLVRASPVELSSYLFDPRIP